jgi:arylsulfatase A-like enzyme
MPPRASASLAALAALLAACGPRDARPDVLVIVADSLAASHVGSYGYSRPTTPGFDAFAAQGVRFESAYSAAAWTLPSVASLFTSQPQERHGARDDELPLRANLPTLAEAFAAGGWETHAFLQTPVLSSRTGLSRGFDEYRVLDFSTASFERVLDLAAAALDDATAPDFVYLHVAPPHMPYQAPPPFRGRFSADTEHLQHVDGSIASARAVHRSKLAPTHPDVQRLAALYDEHIAYVDAALAQFVSEVRAQARERELLIVWTSDHGEAFMEHGEQGHNSSVFDEMVRVPLAISGSGIPPRVVREPVSLLDLAPTLLEGVGLETLPRAAGLSLTPALRGASLDASRMLVSTSRHYPGRPERWQVGVRSGPFKLCATPATQQVALFDLRSDPRELVDISASEPQVLARLRSEAERAARALEAPEGARSLDTAERRALAELGYADER